MELLTLSGEAGLLSSCEVKLLRRSSSSFVSSLSMISSGSEEEVRPVRRHPNKVSYVLHLIPELSADFFFFFLKLYKFDATVQSPVVCKSSSKHVFNVTFGYVGDVVYRVRA